MMDKENDCRASRTEVHGDAHAQRAVDGGVGEGFLLLQLFGCGLGWCCGRDVTCEALHGVEGGRLTAAEHVDCCDGFKEVLEVVDLIDVLVERLFRSDVFNSQELHTEPSEVPSIEPLV